MQEHLARQVGGGRRQEKEGEVPGFLLGNWFFFLFVNIHTQYFCVFDGFLMCLRSWSSCEGFGGLLTYVVLVMNGGSL